MAINVLMLLHNLRVSAGVSSYVMNYFRTIDHTKIHMDFAIWSDIETPYYEEIRSSGSNIYVLPSIKNIHKHIQMCHKILNEGNYDVIHDNTLMISFPIMKAAEKAHVPVRILHSHNSKLGETRAKEIRNKLFLPLLKGTSTDYAACSKLAAIAMFGDSYYDFIPNVVSAEKLNYSLDKRSVIRKELGAGEKVIIGTVGRVAAQKNPLFAIDVIESLMEKDPNVEYWWIGSGLMDKELAYRVHNSRYKKRIRLLGSRDDVPDLYQAIDVFFLPSLFEGLPVTGVEAQVMGLPSVMSDTITKEVAFTDLVKFVDLSEPIEYWSEVLLEQIKRVPIRRSYIEELRNSPFSDQRAGAYLAQIYEKLIGKHVTCK